MKRLHRFHGATVCVGVSLFLVAAVPGCRGYGPMKVQSSYGPGVKFTGLGSTYDWDRGVRETTGDAGVDNPYLHALITQIVEDELAAKGFTKKTTGTPDFWVQYRLARRLRNQLEGAELEYSEGTVVFYVIDPPTRQWIWRASAEARLVESKPPAEKEQRLREAFSRMFKDFPAKRERLPANTR